MIQLRVVKGQTPYIEIRGDPWFLPVCYSDYGVEREDDNKVSLDTQPGATVDTPASLDFRDIFLVEPPIHLEGRSVECDQMIMVFT